MYACPQQVYCVPLYYVFHAWSNLRVNLPANSLRLEYTTELCIAHQMINCNTWSSPLFGLCECCEKLVNSGSAKVLRQTWLIAVRFMSWQQIKTCSYIGACRSKRRPAHNSYKPTAANGWYDPGIIIIIIIVIIISICRHDHHCHHHHHHSHPSLLSSSSSSSSSASVVMIIIVIIIIPIHHCYHLHCHCHRHHHELQATGTMLFCGFICWSWQSCARTGCFEIPCTNAKSVGLVLMVLSLARMV